MRVALINNLYVDQLGLFYISSVLKSAGHDVRFFLPSNYLESELKRFSPQLVGFSALTGGHLLALETASEIKKFLPGVKTIIGGAHATYYPEVLHHPAIDFVCRGEAEISVVELCNEIERSGNPEHVKGVWAKEGDKIYKNPLQRLVEDLDTIPFPDRSIYKQYPFSGRFQLPFIITSRGCPYKCTFCFEPTKRELMKGNGKYIRFRSVENVIQEAREIKRAYRIKHFEFVDDIFGMRFGWLKEFSERWREEIGTQFQCNLRADLVTEEVVELLARAGCRSVAFGVESGDQFIRNEILRKDITDGALISAARALRKKKIRIITYNILGSPGETIEDAYTTLHINQKIRPHYASVSLMQPYPRTGIYRIALERGQISDTQNADGIAWTFHDTTPMNLPDRRLFVNLQKLFNIPVWFPQTEPMIRLLVKFPENFLFYWLFIIIHAYGLWFRVKRIPARFIIQLLLNVRNIVHRYRYILGKHKYFNPRKVSAQDVKKQGAL